MKLISRNLLACVATTATLAVSSAVQAQPLANAGFETGDLTGWASSNASVGAPGVGAQAGNFAALLTVPGGFPPTPQLSQTFAANPGDEFYLSGYMLTESALPGGVVFGFAKIVFRDAGGTDLEPASISIGTAGFPPFPGAESLPRLDFSSPVNTWVLTEAQAVAPPDTVEVTFFALNVNLDGNEHPMWFDSMEAVHLNPPDIPTRPHPGWNSVNNGITLTANEPTYWSALTGQPKGVSPFTVLDPGFPPGRPAMDGSGDRVLRGYVIAWAVDQFGEEIRWNHLKGEGTIVNYRDSASWEYNTWNHAVVANVANGDTLPEPGVLRLDGSEYAQSFDELLLNFQAAGSGGFSAPPAFGFLVESDTDLTLFPPSADLRQNGDGPVTTKASMDIWNENETKFSGAHRCITCWDQTLLSRYDTPNHFCFAFLQTNHGKTRIDGHAADICNVLDDLMTPEDESVTSIFSPLLGVYARHLEINGVNTASSGSNLVGMGVDDTAVIQYDVAGGGGPPEGQMPDDPAKRIDWLTRLVEGPAKRPGFGDARHAEHNEPMTLSGITQDRVSGTEKGSLLFFSNVELRWGGPPTFSLIQDTFLSLTNDFPEDVRVQMYFINGDPPIDVAP